jgi:hypothetical protein
VAVAKARNVAYYDNAAQLQAADQVPGIPAGASFTNRTFRYLAQPFFPQGIEGKPPGPFSPLNDPAVNPANAQNNGPPQPASAYTSLYDYEAFHPDANFHAPTSPANQNGVVFFPGSSAVYTPGTASLIGGFGVSGDGVNQDDFVTAGGVGGFGPPDALTVDNFKFRDVRLPYANYSRNPTDL